MKNKIWRPPAFMTAAKSFVAYQILSDEAVLQCYHSPTLDQSTFRGDMTTDLRRRNLCLQTTAL